MSGFKDTFITVLVAGLAAGGGTFAVNKSTPPPAQVVNQPQTNVVVKDANNMTRAEARKVAMSWGELTQKEIDALTIELRKLGKKNIVVFCANDDLCGDMALDFINAIGSAKWDFDQEVPLVDRTTGIGVSDPATLAAIRAAVPRLPVVPVAFNETARIALVIGKKS